MCGIAGFVDPSLNKDQQQVGLNAMLHAIAHRGPNFRNTYFHHAVGLGHNRLSVIDLTSGGNQPMIYKDWVIVFNGEVYNYLELKSELKLLGHTFISNSDTEVVVAAYDQWGKAAVQKMVGMWSMVIYNNKTETLFVSRDRFGIKPFYYTFIDGRFYFASEVKALVQTPTFTNDLNYDQVNRALQLGWVHHQTETFYRVVNSLPAAHHIELINGKLHIEKFWDINTSVTNTNSFEENKEQFRALFYQSIDLHLRSDLPVAACLSGGLDSSAIASVIKTKYPDTIYKSFSIFYSGDNEVDERPFIKKLIDQYPGIDPFYYEPKNIEVEEAFETMCILHDEPIIGSSYISQYFLMRFIHQQQITVVLDGQGSDEYLAGYKHTRYALGGDLLKQGKWANYYNFSKQIAHSVDCVSPLSLFKKSFACSIFSPSELLALEYKYNFPFLPLEKKSVIQTSSYNKSAFQEQLKLQMKVSSLPNLLQFEDRNSMAFSIESRVPFLDHRLVEFAFSLNADSKYHEGVSKYVLRESLKQELPDAIYNRKDKKGFVTPGESTWLRHQLAHQLNLDYSQLDFLDISKTKKIVQDYRNGNDANAKLVWRLMAINKWLGKVNKK
ncbi:MAG: asparagine synthase (glutamine-hydrolyzing) [Saprospiraceae bacterium]|jgi:asparagine synthase (glutamine-hydrolysing)|nr:asparagine synthase (glutamine-hydrolyzing) [Saprospiraceae bacterium]